MKPYVVVDSRIRLPGEVVAELPREQIDALKLACTHPNPDYLTWVAFRRVRGHPPAKVVSMVKKDKGGGLSMPRGCMDAVFTTFGRDVGVKDRRTVVDAPSVPWRGNIPYPYQQRLIDFGLESATRDWVNGTWRAPAGAGKTELLLNLISQLRLKTLVIVPKESIFTQWVRRVRQTLEVEPGVVQGKTRTIGDLVTIGMQQTLWRGCDDLRTEFGALLADEAQLFAAKTPREVVDVFPAVFRVAVSADEQRSDGREFLIYDYFGPLAQEVTRDEAKASGGIVDVEVVVVPTSFEADWYKKLKPDQKFLRRSELLEQISADVPRNVLLADVARSVYDAEGLQVALLAERVEHCMRLESLLCSNGSCVRLTGEDPKSFTSNVEDFATGRARFAVCTYKKVGVGFESHRELARGIFASPVVSKDGSRMQFEQFLGRFARPAAGKSRGRVYYPLDVRVFGKRPATFILKWIGPDKTFVDVGGHVSPLRDWLKKKEKHETTHNDDSDTGGFFGQF